MGRGTGRGKYTRGLPLLFTTNRFTISWCLAKEATTLDCQIPFSVTRSNARRRAKRSILLLWQLDWKNAPRVGRYAISNRIKPSLSPTRGCHGIPWGFPGQPAPVPVETRTRVHGCGFLHVRVMGLVKPTGSQTRTGLGQGLYDITNKLYIYYSIIYLLKAQTMCDMSFGPCCCSRC